MKCTGSGAQIGRKLSKRDVGTTTVRPPSQEEWEAALQGAMSNDIAPTGRTVPELMEISGRSEKQVRGILRRLIADGLAVCYPRGRMATKITGIQYKVPTYGLLRKVNDEFTKRDAVKQAAAGNRKSKISRSK